MPLSNLTVSRAQSFSDSAAQRTLPKACHQGEAQAITQRRDRVGHMALRALGCPVGRNPQERQALGVR